MILRSEVETLCLELERDHPGAPASKILHQFYQLFAERDEQSAIIGRLRDALAEVSAELASERTAPQ